MQIMPLWNRMKDWPAGRRLFSFLIGKRIPYSGSIGASVVELGSGSAEVILDEKRAVQNHLGSAHAVALMNLCELTSGLAIHSAMPSTHRAILRNFEIEFLKKARGRLTAKSTYTGCMVDGSKELPTHFDEKVGVQVFNADGELLCQAYALWRVGSKSSKN
jgi:acyl-coenzyme A thioesterase PaaI-like protein